MECLPPGAPSQTGSLPSGPQEEAPRHTAEQIVDSAPVVPILDVLVLQMVSGEVGDVLGPALVGVWSSSGCHAAGVHQDLARLEWHGVAQPVKSPGRTEPREAGGSHCGRATLSGRAFP